MLKIHFPLITGDNPKEQIIQIRKYLYQLVEELQALFSILEQQKTTETANIVKSDTSVISSRLGLSESLANTGVCYYRITDNKKHIYIAFNCSFIYDGNDVIINSKPIPLAYRPSKEINRIVSGNDSNIAKIVITTDGYIKIVWVKDLENSEAATISISSIDGYLDYFIGG